MMRNCLEKAVLFVFVMALSACSASPPEAEKSVDEILAQKNLKIVEEVDRLVGFNIHGWQSVNNWNVVLNDGPSKYYLVELNAPCRNLQYAQRIAFTSFGRVVSKNERLIVTDGPGHVENCFMKAFYRLEKIKK